MRFEVAARSSSGGHKFVLHALRVLSRPHRAASRAADGRASIAGKCDASMPTRVHEYLSPGKAGSQGY